MADVKITVRRNGPFRVEAPEGSIEMVDADGVAYDLSTKMKDGKLMFSLCRCGGSINKPFCDGTHSKIGFQGAEAAVQQAEGGASGQPKPVENNPSSSSPAKG
jgi:CDGSH-type Zn-finger protein